ncbi:MAG: site-2 protease family protein [Ruminococcaceae bacterium]|nr:site-2 protease family protein [Oscillospiraceae bacterium]
MISSILSGNFDIYSFLLRIPVVLLALSIHEYAHGYAAYKMGDPTAKYFGRFTLNPVKHLDIIGTICMFLFGFGWAKPVPVNARNFNNPRKGMAITALAGPVSNVLLSFLGLILYNTTYLIMTQTSIIYNSSEFVLNIFTVLLVFFSMFHYLNLSLAIFNLIPLPPLDGSRIAFVLLPDRLYFNVMKYEQTIQIILMVCLCLGILDVPLRFLITNLSDGMQKIINLVIGLFI